MLNSRSIIALYINRQQGSKMNNLSRRAFMGSGAAAAMLLSGCRTGKMFGTRKQPNILFIFSDDHAQAAISAYGKHLKDAAPTPHLDRIAKEGAIFERSYCANSICGPSRACILTGKHSHINGYIDNERCRFNGDQPTFPKYLQQAGYQTAIIGKWHLVSDPQGFDYWEVLPGQGNYYNPDFLQQGGAKKRYQGYCTDLVTDFSLDWLKNRRDPNKPFMLMCQHKAPHRNWLPPERYYDLFKGVDIPEPATLFDDYSNRSQALKEQEMSIEKDFHWGHDMLLHGKPTDPRFLDRHGNGEYDRMTDAQKKRFDAAYGAENESLKKALAEGRMDDKELTRWKYQRYIKNYLRCIRAVDDSVGRLLDYLDESGLAEDTIVIYSSDQGFYLGEHGWYDKRWMFEESFAMPFLIRWKDVIKPGSRSQALIQNIDYAPTFMELAGLQPASDMQGRSLVPLFKRDGVAPSTWRKSIYYAYYGERTHHVARHDGVATSRYKLFFMPDMRGNERWQLFDLLEDPQEMRSVHMDSAYAQVFADLKSEYYRLRREYNVNSSIIPCSRTVQDWWLERFNQKNQECRKTPGCQLLFLGDSITHGFDRGGKEVWDKNFARYKAVNLGFGGDRTEHLLWRIKYSSFDKMRPKVAVMMIGTNNTGHLQCPANETALGVKACIDELRHRLPGTKILLLAIFPRGADKNDPLRKLNDRINAIIKGYADGVNVHFMDINHVFLRDDGVLPKEIMPDFLHPVKTGYERWAAAITPKFKALGL
jgi:arylsulfatase A-like enzyme/lysophospholipase L1-like esterase